MLVGRLVAEEPPVSLDALGRELLELSPEELEAFYLANPDMADVIDAALAEEDLERFIAGRNLAELRKETEQSGLVWLRQLFPTYASAPFAPHMEDFWAWVWAIRRGSRPSPRVDVWFRGGAKSTSAEAAVIALGALGKRRYGLYISDTNDLAEEHLMNIQGMLGSPRFAALYPEMASRAVTEYGSARGWSRKRLHTAAGFVVDAFGLSTNVRGIRVDEDRPDFIILDDLDSDLDGPSMVEKKIDLLTKKILPAGSTDLAVLGIQNLVHPNSIFARLAGVSSEKVDFLADRITIGPIPAIEGLEVEVDPEDGRHVVVGGQPTWEGYDLTAAQGAIDTFGFSAFLAEAQHLVQPAAGGMWDNVSFVRCNPDEVPALAMRTCWCDPAIEGDDGSDSQGIQIDGMTSNGVVYRLWSWEGKVGPQEAILMALRQAIRYRCSTLGIETDQGGKTWQSVYAEACRVIRDRFCGTCWTHFQEQDPVAASVARAEHFATYEGHKPYTGDFPGYRYDKAGRGRGPKVHRASQMLADYETGSKIVHVRGTHVLLEAALRRFPRVKPFDLVDAAFWSWEYCRARRASMGTRRSGRTVARSRLPTGAGGRFT